MSITDIDLPLQKAKALAVEDLERSFFTACLRRHEGNISQAAREASMHRQNLQKKLRQLRIDPKEN